MFAHGKELSLWKRMGYLKFREILTGNKKTLGKDDVNYTSALGAAPKGT